MFSEEKYWSPQNSPLFAVDWNIGQKKLVQYIIKKSLRKGERESNMMRLIQNYVSEMYRVLFILLNGPVCYYKTLPWNALYSCLLFVTWFVFPPAGLRFALFAKIPKDLMPLSLIIASSRANHCHWEEATVKAKELVNATRCQIIRASPLKCPKQSIKQTSNSSKVTPLSK